MSQGSTPSITPQHDPDVDLMLQVRDGKPGAFEAVVERHKQRVFGVLYRVFGRRQDLEDLAQEVFLRVYRARRRYRPSAKFSTWLYTITTRVAFNAMRTRARRPTVPMADAAPGRDVDTSGDAGMAVSAEPAPDHALQHKELVETVRQAIDRLPRQQRVALVLNKFEGLSYQDIAETLGMTVAAVRSLLARARANLRDSLLPALKQHGHRENGN